MFLIHRMFFIRLAFVEQPLGVGSLPLTINTREDPGAVPGHPVCHMIVPFQQD